MKRSVYVAVGLALIPAVWMLSGQLPARQGDGEQALAPVASAPPAMQVQVRESVAREVSRRIRVLGQLEPRRSVTLRAETIGTVVEAPARKGRELNAGDVLVVLSTDDRQDRLKEAEALVAQRQAELRAARKLGSRGLQSENAGREAAALLAAAEAARAAARLDINRSRIRAPFAGVLNERPVEIGDLLERGDEVATVVEVDRLLATAQVPQNNVAAIRAGQRVQVLPATGDAVEGQIAYVSGVADPATRSFRVEVAVDNSDRKLVAGMSATLEIPLSKVSAHYVSPALLTLGAKGEIGVMGANDEDSAVFHPVSMVRTDAEGGIWIAGLPARVRLITLGQGFVAGGQPVRPVPEPDEPSATSAKPTQ